MYKNGKNHSTLYNNNKDKMKEEATMDFSVRHTHSRLHNIQTVDKLIKTDVLRSYGRAGRISDVSPEYTSYDTSLTLPPHHSRPPYCLHAEKLLPRDTRLCAIGNKFPRLL